MSVMVVGALLISNSDIYVSRPRRIPVHHWNAVPTVVVVVGIELLMITAPTAAPLADHIILRRMATVEGMC